MAFIRFWLLLAVVQAGVWLVLRLSLRARRREQLQAGWDLRHPDRAGNSRARRAFVARAMAGFDRRLRIWLAVLVWGLPTLTVMAIVYLVNWQ